MKWLPYSLHFKQSYEGGYGYLDKCGEFMGQAQKHLNFIPGQAKPTGAQMEIPELGISSTADTSELILGQEQPDDDGKRFSEIIVELSSLANKCYGPFSIYRNGLASKFYWPMSSADEALKATLESFPEQQSTLAKTIGMSSLSKNLDYTYKSGSFELHVVLRPVTFEQVAYQKLNPSFRASSFQKNVVNRINKRTERIKKDLAYGIMMELDYMESDPPENSLAKQFKELKSKEESLQKVFQWK